MSIEQIRNELEQLEAKKETLESKAKAKQRSRDNQIRYILGGVLFNWIKHSPVDRDRAFNHLNQKDLEKVKKHLDHLKNKYDNG